MVIHFKCDFGNNIDFYWYCFFFFSKQKTAYEILGDWSSDVCSSDLRILRARKPASLEICTLLSKPSRRQANIEVKYLGFEVPDEFVVGYGIDFAGRYRNLRDIQIGRASCRERV